MAILSHRWKKYLLIIPLAALILFVAVYYMNENRIIREILLTEKFITVTDSVDMLADAVEVNAATGGRRNANFIVSCTESIDKIYQVYACAYSYDDGYLEQISERYSENANDVTLFDPFDHPEFAEAVYANDMGSVTVESMGLDRYLYYRWMPLGDYGQKFLVVAGVSRLSVITQIPILVSIVPWVFTAVLTGLTVGLVLLLTRLGYIYKSRHGGKWRDNRDADYV